MACTGHSLGLCGKTGKKKLALSFPGVDCLANFVGIKFTTSGLYCLCLMSSCANSADIHGLTSAINMAVLWVKSVMDSPSFDPWQST